MTSAAPVAYGNRKLISTIGNKTSSHGDDSRMGKVMEKVGHMTNNEGLVDKGRAKREAKGFDPEVTTQT